MTKKTCLIVLSVFVCASSMAAHIVTDTRSGSALIKRTHTYANAAGDLRIDEQGFNASASSVSGSAAVGESTQVEYEPGEIEDTTIFQSKEGAIISLEGDICRRMTADSEPPLGLGGTGVDLGDLNKQMADAMKQASSQIEQAMKQARKEGMTAEQERTLRQFTDVITETGQIEPRDALHAEKMNQRVRVGRFTGEGYLVKDSDGIERHRVWVIAVNKIAGGRQIRHAMEGMYSVYTEYLENMGGGALMETELTGLFFGGELAGTYPVRIEDLENGEITDVVEANSGGDNVDFYPDCIVKDMFGQ